MKKFDRILELQKKLRGKDGCPWDREQTIKTIKESMVKEMQEVADAVDKEDNENLKEELGDLIWNIALITRIAEENGLFNMEDVLKGIAGKIVHRHPHVFGDAKAKNAEDAMKSFLEAKVKEKKKPKLP